MTIVIPIWVMLVTAWLLAGLLGSWALYYDWCRTFPYDGWCPSPAGIILVLLGTLGGVVVLSVGCIVSFINYMEKPNWFNTPICKRKSLTNE